MKCLIAISGQYRTFEKTYQNILSNVINCNPDYEFDIILSTDFENRNIFRYDGDINFSGETFGKQDLESRLNACYGKYLKHIIYYNIREDERNIPGSVIFFKRNILVMNYVEENNIKYDKIICMRFDIVFSSPVNLNFKNKLIFICGEQRNSLRIDHVSDWDFCFLSDNIITLKTFLGMLPVSSELTYNDLLDYSSKTNFETGYIDLVKEKKRLIVEGDGSWVLGLWRKFYDLHLLGYHIDFKREIYATIVKFN